MKFLLFAVILQASSGADGSPPFPESDSIDVVETASRLIGASLPLDPKVVMLAARAYAEGRAWPDVLRLLVGQPWLAEADAGRALLEIGRAYAGLDSLTAALASYRAYMEVRSESEKAAGAGMPFLGFL